jgi:hypothetical protein
VIQASDVAHTMQHWHIYVVCNRNLTVLVRFARIITLMQLVSSSPP